MLSQGSTATSPQLRAGIHEAASRALPTYQGMMPPSWEVCQTWPPMWVSVSGIFSFLKTGKPATSVTLCGHAYVEINPQSGVCVHLKPTASSKRQDLGPRLSRVDISGLGITGGFASARSDNKTRLLSISVGADLNQYSLLLEALLLPTLFPV